VSPGSLVPYPSSIRRALVDVSECELSKFAVQGHFRFAQHECPRRRRVRRRLPATTRPASSSWSTIAERFVTDAVFNVLRLEAYFEAAARRSPEVAGGLLALSRPNARDQGSPRARRYKSQEDPRRAARSSVSGCRMRLVGATVQEKVRNCGIPEPVLQSINEWISVVYAPGHCAGKP